MLSMDRRRAFGLWLLIAMIAYLLLYINDISYVFMDARGDALATFSMSGATGMVTYIMPLFAALPFATGFCADWSSGYTGVAVMRAGKRKYLMSKILACALSGGVATAGGTLLLIALLVLKFPHTEEVILNFIDVGEFYDILALEGTMGLILFYAGVVLVQFLAGSFWAMTGLAFSAFCPNFLLTLCIPLAAYRLCLELYYWIEFPLWLCPPLLQDLMVGLSYGPTLLTAAGVFIGLDVLLGFVFAWRAGRRLRYAQ